MAMPQMAGVNLLLLLSQNTGEGKLSVLFTAPLWLPKLHSDQFQLPETRSYSLQKSHTLLEKYRTFPPLFLLV